MTNHFASLLINASPVQQNPLEEGFLLSTDDGFIIIVSPTGENILLEGYGGAPTFNPYSLLIDRNFVPIPLPESLENFRQLLFPSHVTDYYRQFLLYYYLRLVAASDKSDDTLKYDKRLTYDLDEIQDYFRFTKISAPKTNSTSFRLLLSGALHQSDDVQSFANNFVISQIEDSTSVLVFSNTEKKYYKAGKVASNSSVDMEIPLVLDLSNPSITKPIAIGETGLQFSLTGPFTAIGMPTNFTTSANKFWSFTAEAPASVDFNRKLTEIELSYKALEDMFNFAKESCNSSYENIWHSHYNSVYRFAGLLLAYVERVNTLWLTT